MSKSYLDLVKECDNFPYYADDPILYQSRLRNYYAFKVAGCDKALGYIAASVVRQFTWPPAAWLINHATQEVILGYVHPQTPAVRSKLIADTLRGMSDHPNFRMLRIGWRNETFPVYGPGGELLLEVERCASALFGIVSAGVQLTCFVTAGGGDNTAATEAASSQLRIWIARRSKKKQTWPGMLDNAAAGGIETGLCPSVAVMREAVEEASLCADTIRRGLRSTGTLSYLQIIERSDGPSDEAGKIELLQPEIEYVYELRLDAGVVPTPGDSEVEQFYLWSVEEIKDALRRGEFKPNSAIVLIDFFIRHGVLTPELEPDYFEIVARLHRRLDFPTPVIKA